VPKTFYGGGGKRGTQDTTKEVWGNGQRQGGSSCLKKITVEVCQGEKKEREARTHGGDQEAGRRLDSTLEAATPYLEPVVGKGEEQVAERPYKNAEPGKGRAADSRDSVKIQH